MNITIKHVATEQQLDATLAFDKKVFGHSSENHSPAYSRNKWVERMKTHGDLMLYAEMGGEVIGIVFGRIENGNSITVGPVAVDERFRKHGIARELMFLLEKRALRHGIHHLGLGAVESAEEFYQKLGYTGTLLVQSEKHSIDELLSLNEKYPVRGTNVYEGTVNQVFLGLPFPDRELQRQYEATLPGCYTQMIFEKTIQEEDNTMKNNIGNYARHAQFWDWSGHDRTGEHEHWRKYAAKYGKNVLIPMCAWGETGAYLAKHGMNVTAFDITPEMIAEGKKRYGNIPGLKLYEADVRDFRFDLPPADFCYSMDFGHILTIEDVKRALVCINNHLRDGGGLVIETGLRMPDAESNYTPTETFHPLTQVYPDMKVWKTGETRNDADTGRCYISQTFYAENSSGNVESFDHAFYLQSYTREEWLEACRECGFDVIGEYNDRALASWQSGGSGCRIFEAVKSTAAKKKYSPVVNLDYLQTPIYRYENVAIYNDNINLQQPNDGYIVSYRFDINADNKWVGWINVKIGYSISAYYDGQIGFMINDDQERNHGYMTKACLALRPFLKKCGYGQILISTDENNAPCRRVMEKIGAVLLETVDTPTWTGIYRQGQRRTCIYEWKVEEATQQDNSKMKFIHTKIDLDADREYALERHCRINYECDTPWARKLACEQYQTNWLANAGQQNEFLTALRESMEDKRTIAEIIRTESGEIVGYLWVPFHGETDSFMCWADVQDIYVEESFRNNGVATYLMDYAEKSAKRNSARVIRSGTGCENIASQGLHQKLSYYQYRYEYEKVLQEDTKND